MGSAKKCKFMNLATSLCHTHYSTMIHSRKSLKKLLSLDKSIQSFAWCFSISYITLSKVCQAKHHREDVTLYASHIAVLFLMMNDILCCVAHTGWPGAGVVRSSGTNTVLFGHHPFRGPAMERVCAGVEAKINSNVEGKNCILLLLCNTYFLFLLNSLHQMDCKRI